MYIHPNNLKFQTLIIETLLLSNEEVISTFKQIFPELSLLGTYFLALL